MANPIYSSGQVTIGTTPTLIASPGSGLTMLVGNGSGAVVFLGGPNVSTTTGFPLAISTNVVVPVAAAQSTPLYGVVASTTSVVSYLSVT